MLNKIPLPNVTPLPNIMPHVERMWQRKIVQGLLVRKLEIKTRLGKPKVDGENNITMDLKEIGW